MVQARLLEKLAFAKVAAQEAEMARGGLFGGGDVRVDGDHGYARGLQVIEHAPADAS
jgi:hypothetical protein